MDKDYKVESNISIAKSARPNYMVHSPRFWSHEDLKLLLLGKDVPGKSKLSIRRKTNILRKNGIMLTGMPEDIEVTIRRSKDPAKGKEYKIKLVQSQKQDINIQYWNDEEITALLNGDTVPGRSNAICRAKLAQLDLEGYDVQDLVSRYKGGWTASEIDLLQKGKTPDGRSRHAAHTMRSKLGLASDRLYAESELQIIREYYPTEYLDVCLRLNRSANSIRTLVIKMISKTEQSLDGKAIRDFIMLHNKYGPDAWRYTDTKDYFLCMNIASQLDLNMNRWTFAEDKAIATYGKNIQLKNRTQAQIEFRSEHLYENAISRRITHKEKEIILNNFSTKGFRLLYDLPQLKYYEIEIFAYKHHLKRPKMTEKDRAEAIELAAKRRGTF